MKDSKVLITGTGRAGTTFLILIFTLLDLDTGFTRETYKRDLFHMCNNTGMEKVIQSNNEFLKNPLFILDMPKIHKKYDIKYVIIPIRDYEQSATSRYNNHRQHTKGALWEATDVDSQVQFYHKIMANYLKVMVELDIPTIFLDFHKMVVDPTYLYDKLSPILSPKNITQSSFEAAFHEATSVVKPPPKKNKLST